MATTVVPSPPPASTVTEEPVRPVPPVGGAPGASIRIPAVLRPGRAGVRSRGHLQSISSGSGGVPSCVRRDERPGVDIIVRSYPWRQVVVALFAIFSIVWVTHASVENKRQQQREAAQFSLDADATAQNSDGDVTVVGSLSPIAWFSLLSFSVSFLIAVLSLKSTRVEIDKSALTLTELQHFVPCVCRSESRTVDLTPVSIGTVAVCIDQTNHSLWTLVVSIRASPPSSSSSCDRILLDVVESRSGPSCDRLREDADALKWLWKEYLAGVCATGEWNTRPADDDAAAVRVAVVAVDNGQPPTAELANAEAKSDPTT